LAFLYLGYWIAGYGTGPLPGTENETPTGGCMFFEVLDTWMGFGLFLLGSLCYLVLFGATTTRVVKDTFKSRGARKVRQWLGSWFPRFVFGLGLLIICIMLGYIFAPAMWVVHRRRDHNLEQDHQRQRIEKNREQAERQGNRNEENRARRVLRDQWLAENPLKLFYNTMDGVTAVLRPADYQEAARRTSYAVADGLWETEQIFVLQRPTYVFGTVEGQKIVRERFGTTPRLLSELYDLRDCHGVELVRDERIFVPAMNERMISFREQVDSVARPTYPFQQLVEAQAPPEMRHLPDVI
jgi:hypothetical protein